MLACTAGFAAVLLTACASSPDRPAADGSPRIVQPIGATSSTQAITPERIAAVDPNRAASASDAESDHQSAIDSDYRIGPSDLLEVTVFGVEDLDRAVRVNTTGQISMPLIGAIEVAGLTASEAEKRLEEAYGEKYLQHPQISIFIKEFTSQRITVDGAVSKPGIYPLTGQITLLRALAMAGGAGGLADMEHVKLFRVNDQGKTEAREYDVNKIRNGEDIDPTLNRDDVVVVNRVPSRVTLRDSLFRDIIDTINPFSASYRNASAP